MTGQIQVKTVGDGECRNEQSICSNVCYPLFSGFKSCDFFFLSALLRELGSPCADHGYGAIESTRDAALLGSSRAGTDQTHVAGVGKLDVIQGEKL